MDKDISVFESTIRLVGGLLALYDSTKDRMFLKKAKELADLLCPAFDTDSGYPKVLNDRSFSPPVIDQPSLWTTLSIHVDSRQGHSLRSGHHQRGVHVGSPKRVNRRYLSKATWKRKYRRIAERIYNSLEKVESLDGLLPSYLDVKTGKTGGGTYTMGGMADSYYEYLLKAWILGGKKDKVGICGRCDGRGCRGCTTKPLMA